MSESSLVGEYKRYVAVFYLHKRKKPRYFHSDPLMRFYRWYIAYFRITRDDVLGKVWRVHYSSKGFGKNVVNDGDTQLVLPAHSPEYYVEFAKELDTEVSHHRRKVELPRNGERVRVDVPVILFNSDSHGHLHMLFSTVLATYVNPSGSWRKISGIILDEKLWCDTLGVIAMGRFTDVRGSDYMYKGVHHVRRVGKAFRALYGLL
ncbi:MAG: hypothetical protein QXZ48_04230 [Zestosphaera sp.]